MARIFLAEEIFHIQGATFARVERTDTLVDIGTERRQLFDVRKKLAADLLLIGIREPGNLRDGLFERSDHEPRLAHSPSHNA